MHASTLPRFLVGGLGNCLISGCLLGAVMIASALGQADRASIRLVPQEHSQIRTQGLPTKELALLDKMPSHYHHFGATGVDKVSAPEILTLQFAVATQITRITSTPDFKVLLGGSCQEGRAYFVASTCQVRALFTPQGPGHRLGKLTVTTANGDSVSFGLLGFSSFPVISFTPSVITTVPPTVSGGVGQISGAQNLAIDSGDSLYIADTGNNEIRYMDSSGVLRTLASGYTAPHGVTVDTMGEVYFDLPALNAMYEVYDYGPVVQINGSGTGSCPASSPCSLNSHAVTNPGELSTDGHNNVFFVEQTSGAALSTVLPTPADLILLYDPFPYQTNPSSAMAVDSGDNLYSEWSSGGECQIMASTLFNAENSNVNFTKVVGGHTCGFSGDGGLAAGAEIGSVIGQIVFDTAGNMYFTDSSNNRVRRVDASTGIIRTIAGTGTAGYKGDGGPATAAALNAPTGVTADSEGQVYILSNSAATGTAQVVRKIGATGVLVFPSTKSGTASGALLINVANTGNNTLNFVHTSFTGTNPGDFSIDANTTSCNFATGNFLVAGQSCQIGIIFKPGAVGPRAATLNLLDNTVNGVNIVKLSGPGAAAAVVKFTAPSTAQVIKSGTKISVAVTVTSANAPAPTGKVNFSVDGKFVASGTIAAGKASIEIGGVATGTHTLVASYPGDKDHIAAKATETIKVSN